MIRLVCLNKENVCLNGDVIYDLACILIIILAQNLKSEAKKVFRIGAPRNHIETTVFIFLLVSFHSWSAE